MAFASRTIFKNWLSEYPRVFKSYGLNDFRKYNIDFLVLVDKMQAIFLWFFTLRGNRTESELSVLEKLQGKSKIIMSNITKDEEMRPEYDFSNGVRGKHYQAYQQGTNVVLLEPDIAEVFKNSEAVNHALRMLLDLAGNEVKRNLIRGSIGHS